MSRPFAFLLEARHNIAVPFRPSLGCDTAHCQLLREILDCNVTGACRTNTPFYASSCIAASLPPPSLRHGIKDYRVVCKSRNSPAEESHPRHTEPYPQTTGQPRVGRTGTEWYAFTGKFSSVSSLYLFMLPALKHLPHVLVHKQVRKPFQPPSKPRYRCSLTPQACRTELQMWR